MENNINRLALDTEKVNYVEELANLLSLNIKKTNYILFSNKVIEDVSILIGKEIITRVFETKFLGVLIQANIKWNAHVNSVANKISKTIGILNKVK